MRFKQIHNALECSRLLNSRKGFSKYTESVRVYYLLKNETLDVLSEEKLPENEWYLVQEKIDYGISLFVTALTLNENNLKFVFKSVISKFPKYKDNLIKTQHKMNHFKNSGYDWVDYLNEYFSELWRLATYDESLSEYLIKKLFWVLRNQWSSATMAVLILTEQMRQEALNHG